VCCFGEGGCAPSPFFVTFPIPLRIISKSTHYNMSHTKETATIEMNKLLLMHSLTDWNVAFDNAKRRLGRCKFRIKTISLSLPFIIVTTKSEIKDVMLHEIAHALVGSGHGHNEVWRSKAIEIGCTGLRTYKGEVSIAKKFRGACPSCGKIIERHRRIKIACGKCCKTHNNNKLSPDYLFIWEIND